MKKQKEGEFLKKKDKACKFTEGKKVLTILAAIGIVLGSILGLVACNNNKVPQKGPDTGIVQPGGDEEEGEQGGNQGGNQGGETTKPDEGEEEKPNPDNPGGDIEQPEDPDQGDEEELEPPTTIEDIFPDNSDHSMTDAEFKDALKDANEYKNIFIENLNENLYEKIIKKAYSKVDFNLINKDEVKWGIDVDQNDPSKISKITISFIYQSSDTNATYYVESVVPEIDMYLSDLFNAEYDGYDAAFDTSRFGAKFTRELAFTFDPSIQGKYASLAKALNDASGKSGESTYIVPLGYSDDDTLKEVMRFTVFNWEENGYNKATYRIKGTSASSLNDLIKSIQEGNSYSYDNESKTFSGHQITVIEEDEAASTASENIEVKYYKITTTDKTGATKIKYGSTVKLFDSMGRVAHTQGFSAANKKQIKKIVEKYTDDFANKEVFGEIGGYVITLDKER